MFWPISAGTLLGAMMSSARSTFVRRWPSEPDLLDWLGVGLVEGSDQMGIAERDGDRLCWREGRGWSVEVRTTGCCVDAGGTYGVACGELLLGADDSSTSLSLVDCSFASDNGLALRGTSAGLAADLGYRVPIV